MQRHDTQMPTTAFTAFSDGTLGSLFDSIRVPEAIGCSIYIAQPPKHHLLQHSFTEDV